MTVYGIKIVRCYDWNIVEGDTKPGYSSSWYKRLFQNREDAVTRANLLEQKYADDCTFAGAVVCEFVEKVNYEGEL